MQKKNCKPNNISFYNISSGWLYLASSYLGGYFRLYFIFTLQINSDFDHLLIYLFIYLFTNLLIY